ncbi:hypothetical protein [Pinirhizobacter soli]|uniref:hypothetical protein n=1 Tax=Pinirhizobacter soli TaxID=2786953 RepID=UPI00202A53A5|nr:hypothetical protein [Pinirhizobacter soli]
MPLVEILSSWNAQRDVQKVLEISGFNVHTAYQRIMHAQALEYGVGAVEALEMVWAESAKEWVTCAGKVNSANRLFHAEVGYRSAYLDELADQQRATGQGVAVALDPLQRAMTFQGEIATRVRNEVMAAIALEKAAVTRRDPKGLSRGSSIEDLVSHLEPGLVEFGFTRASTRLKWRSGNGLRFEVGVEKKKRPSLLFQLQVFFKVWHQDNARPFIYATDFSAIVPGFKYYSIIQDDWDVRYGLDACACMIRAFSRSLSDLSAD